MTDPLHHLLFRGGFRRLPGGVFVVSDELIRKAVEKVRAEPFDVAGFEMDGFVRRKADGLTIWEFARALR